MVSGTPTAVRHKKSKHHAACVVRGKELEQSGSYMYFHLSVDWRTMLVLRVWLVGQSLLHSIEVEVVMVVMVVGKLILCVPISIAIAGECHVLARAGSRT